jgi:hypothetical protein
MTITSNQIYFTFFKNNYTILVFQQPTFNFSRQYIIEKVLKLIHYYK